MIARLLRRRPRSRSSRPKAVEEAKLELTPMIDCVFLLLIFFMCNLEFVKQDGLIKAFLPKDRGQSTGPSVTDLGEVRVKLLWCAPGTTIETEDRDVGEVVLKIEKNVYPRSGATPDWEMLYLDLVKMRDIRDRSGNPDALPVIIDARPLVPHAAVVGALNACVKARIKDVTFAAPERPF